MTNKELQEIKESVALCEAGGPYRRDMENLIQEIERLKDKVVRLRDVLEGEHDNPCISQRIFLRQGGPFCHTCLVLNETWENSGARTNRENSSFIAESRALIPQLIQEIERLRAGLKFYADSIKLAKIIGSNKAWEISETARKLLEEVK